MSRALLARKPIKRVRANARVAIFSGPQTKSGPKVGAFLGARKRGRRTRPVRCALAACARSAAPRNPINHQPLWPTLALLGQSRLACALANAKSYRERRSGAACASQCATRQTRVAQVEQRNINNTLRALLCCAPSNCCAWPRSAAALHHYSRAKQAALPVRAHYSAECTGRIVRQSTHSVRRVSA